MNRTYDIDQARRLVPLLEAISREIDERSAEIARLEGDESASVPVRSALSAHRRGLRNARRELRQLGCRLDEDGAGAILIRGEPGSGPGFRWEPGDSEVREARAARTPG